jgi:putative transposase
LDRATSRRAFTRAGLLCHLSPDLKANSSGWIHDQFPARQEFAWQIGYGAFTVSKSKVPELEVYIGNQHAHHTDLPFAAEYLGLLRKYGIDFDERFVLD